MAESLLFGIAQGVLAKIASLAFQEAVAVYGVEDQIHELKNTVAAITAVLLDAEEQQGKNQRLKLWLGRLRDVLYDAEDVLDEVECEALRKQVTSRYGGVKVKVRRFFSPSNPLVLRAKISDKIKEIRVALSNISNDKNQFDLTERSLRSGVAQMQSRETHSFIEESHVIGRDVDKQRIIEILLQSSDQNLSVIPIVGIGGMGKTTLAKLVYNNDNVINHFELRGWVWVHEDFDLRKTVKRIVEGATGRNLGDLDIEQLQTILRKTIKDKKFLLVLDDVWSDDRSRWEDLKTLLTGGAKGSKIIVTTRSSEVARMMGTHPVHELKGLSPENSMALFKKWAFDQRETQTHPNLLRMGNDIVQKCQGLPLLLKTLGSVLCTNHQEWHWAQIRDSETWKLLETREDIMPVLKLSYDHLPWHLKRCFATFSLFPKGYEIGHVVLERLWVALGLISPTTEKLASEDVTLEHINELWKRSLIQEVDESKSTSTFKVHDLIHSLATIVAQNDCSVVSLDTVEISEGVRYVSFSSTSSKGISNFDGVPPFLRKPTSKRLQAIMFQFFPNDIFITKDFARAFISKCKHLRFLDLVGGDFEELPSSVCNLKQLRLLLLGQNKQLKKLPNTICELQSLLHLSVRSCSKLGDLPKNMRRLVSLRNLAITTKAESLRRCGIQYIENLEYLALVDCPNLRVVFEGTCRPTRLRSLEIEDCGEPISLPSVELIALEHLSIDNCELVLTEGNNSTSFPNLRTLEISEFEQVMELLQCLNESSCKLEVFSVRYCRNFTDIPVWLPDHTRLRSIKLIGCPNLSSMPQGIQSLTDLKALSVFGCGELSKRCRPTTGEDWPKIAHIPRIKVGQSILTRFLGFPREIDD